MATLDSHISIAVLRIVISISAFSGNALLLFVIFRSRRLRKSSSNLLLAQLAFSGIILGIAAGTRGVSTLFFNNSDFTSYPAGLCLILGTPTMLGAYTSQATILAIGIDRFLCIQCPVFYRKSDTQQAALLRFVVCATFSVATVGANFIGVSFDKQVSVCSTGTSMADWFKFYSTFLTCFFTAAISGIYALIYVLFVRKSASSFSKSSSQQKLFGTMTAVLSSYFLIACFPNAIFIVFMFAGLSTLQSYMSIVVSVCSTLTAVTNVFIYGWKHPDLRASLKQMMSKKAVTIVENLHSSNWKTHTHQHD